MASPQPTDSHTRLSNELYNQILMRNFSKRQRKILDLIIRLSYGCGQRTARIPTHKYFEVCGVSRKKVSDELQTLKARNIIDWDPTTGDYWLNKDYETWKITVPSEYCSALLNEVLKLNIIRSKRCNQEGSEKLQNDKRTEERRPQSDGRGIPESGVNTSPKQGQETRANISTRRYKEVLITNDTYLYKEIINKQDHLAESTLEDWLQFGITDDSVTKKHQPRIAKETKGSLRNGGEIHGISRSNTKSDDDLDWIQAKWTCNQ